ncbi:MAG: hypothetical protein ACJAV7_001563 [Flavobacteriales bacterium]|jgi:hypothetical protein
MARYISTQELKLTIDEIVAPTSRLVVILPFEDVKSQKLFDKWILIPDPTIELTLILSGPFDVLTTLTLDAVEAVHKLQSVRIIYHDGPLISRILTDARSLLLPNGFSERSSDKAGVLSKIGIDNQNDLVKIESRSRLVYKKVAIFKKKFFGLQKKFEKSSVVENTLGFDINPS